MRSFLNMEIMIHQVLPPGSRLATAISVRGKIDYIVLSIQNNPPKQSQRTS